MRLKEFLLASTAALISLPGIGFCDPALNALPSGAQVTSGTATLQQSGNTLTVNQSSQRAILNWQSFNIGAKAGVAFNQPNAGSVALNRVLSGLPSEILGSLTANGQVFLVNPSGVVFGNGASVNVGGLVASTMNISDQDFNSGNYNFQRDGSTGSVVNRGHVTAASGGYIGFLAPEIRNEGIVSAKLGTVAMAAGDAVTLTFDNGSLTLQVDPANIATLIVNHQMIAAPDGHVIMSAQAANGIAGGVINNSGVIEANGLKTDGGTVELLASGDIAQAGAIHADARVTGAGGTVRLIAGGTADIGGTISARGGAVAGDGGQIETSGHVVQVAKVKIDTRAPNGKTGDWLIDPYDLTVVDGSGGSFTSGPGSSTIGNQDIDSALATTNVTLSTSGSANDGAGSGDINVNAPIAWNSGGSLTLNAFNNINVAAPITHGGSASAQLSLNPGGKLIVGDGNNAEVTLLSSDTLTISGNRYMLINDITGLQSLSTAQTGYWALNADLDLSQTSFTPIASFSGALEGLGHNIANLTLDLPSSNNVGLFAVNSGMIGNIHLTNETISGGNMVGGLAGDNSGTITNVMVTGAIAGASEVGGLVGQNEAGGVISRIPVYGTVNGSGTNTGGVIGTNYGLLDTGFFDGSVTGNTYVGGFAGRNTGVITNVYAYGAITGNSTVGGIVGSSGNMNTSSSSSLIENAIAQVTVNATSILGGVAGFNAGTISNSFTYWAYITGNTYVGGIAGQNIGLITASYTQDGRVYGAGQNPAWIGGLVGSNGNDNLYCCSVAQTATISQSYNTAVVQADAGASNIGGVAGINAGAAFMEPGTILSSHNDGPVVVGDNSSRVGGLVGGNSNSISGSYLDAGGSVTVGANASYVGGLVGVNSGAAHFINGDIDSSYTAGTVTVGSGATFIGGLVGYSDGAITNSFVTGAVAAGDNSAQIGGLAGFLASRLSTSYAANSVTAGNDSSYIGGLIGKADMGGSLYASVFPVISQSFASTNLAVGTGAQYVGGLIGSFNQSQQLYAGQLQNSYAVGTLTAGTGGNGVGGLIGMSGPGSYSTGSPAPASINDTYAAVAISAPGATNVGGFAGIVTPPNGPFGPAISNSFWDVTVSGMTGTAGTGVTGLTTSLMTQSSSFTSAGWDFTTIWTIQPGQTYPYLRAPAFAAAPVPAP